MIVLETIGLALGFAPLLVELIKHHKKAATPFRAAKHDTHKEWADEFLEDLHYEISTLRVTLDNFVRDLSIEQRLKDRLLDPANIDLALWKNPPESLQLAFQSRLSYCAGAFVKSLHTVLELLTKLVSDSSLPIRIEREDILISEKTLYTRVEEVLQTNSTGLGLRLKFGFKIEKRKKLLDKISKHNAKLQNMLHQTNLANPTFVHRQKQSFEDAMPHFHLWDRIGKFREAMNRIWCKCKGHNLRMGLLKCWNDEDNVSLDIVMDMSKDFDEPTFRWAESQVQVSLRDTHKKRAHVTFEDLPIEAEGGSDRDSTSITGATLSSSPPTSPSAINSTDSIETTASSERLHSPAHYTQRRSRVKRLCEAFEIGFKYGIRTQLHYDQDEIYRVPSQEQQKIEKCHPGIPLTTLLQSDHRLKMRHKKILQVVLAQSLLFFPWHDHAFDKDSVFFFGMHDHDLIKPFTSLNVGSKDDSNDGSVNQTQYFPNRTLASLATLLLEVELDRSIESGYTDEDREDADMNTRYFTTMRLLEENRDDFYHGTRDAIKACLTCDFDSSEMSLDDEDFRRAAYDRIIIPLEEELYRGFKVTTQELSQYYMDNLPSRGHHGCPSPPDIAPRKDSKVSPEEFGFKESSQPPAVLNSDTALVVDTASKLDDATTSLSLVSGPVEASSRPNIVLERVTISASAVNARPASSTTTVSG